MPENEDAEDISTFLGNKTVKVKSVQISQGKRSITTSDGKRALMLLQESQEMPFNKVIIMLRGKKPIYCDKIHYFQESPFIDHLKAMSPTLGKIKGIPTKDQMDSVIADGELQIDIPRLELEQPKPLQPLLESPLDQPLPVEDVEVHYDASLFRD